jgi:hypothetical protein
MRVRIEIAKHKNNSFQRFDIISGTPVKNVQDIFLQKKPNKFLHRTPTDMQLLDNRVKKGLLFSS